MQEQDRWLLLAWKTNEPDVTRRLASAADLALPA